MRLLCVGCGKNLFRSTKQRSPKCYNCRKKSIKKGSHFISQSDRNILKETEKRGFDWFVKNHGDKTWLIKHVKKLIFSGKI